MKIIAHIHTDFPQKFGIPRQSGIIEDLQGTIVFEPEFSDPDAVRGIEGFSHLWLLWQFEGVERKTWSPTVRPPRLGGKKHVGVFASRSPFRPNPIGLSCVKLERVEMTDKGAVLHVSGADLRDNTPIIDIKPYIPFADSKPDAIGGFIEDNPWEKLEVDFPAQLLELVPDQKRSALIAVLEEDPRPPLQDDPEKKYTLAFAGVDVHFTVEENLLRVFDVTPCNA